MFVLHRGSILFLTSIITLVVPCKSLSLLNKRSLERDVAGNAPLLFMNLANKGKLASLTFHHVSGESDFPIGSIARYLGREHFYVTFKSN